MPGLMTFRCQPDMGSRDMGSMSMSTWTLTGGGRRSRVMVRWGDMSRTVTATAETARSCN